MPRRMPFEPQDAMVLRAIRKGATSVYQLRARMDLGRDELDRSLRRLVDDEFVVARPGGGVMLHERADEPAPPRRAVGHADVGADGLAHGVW